MTYRSNMEQDQLYAQGRNGAPGSIVTYVKGGQSDHNYTIDGKPASLAFDAAPIDSKGNIKWDDSNSLKKMGHRSFMFFGYRNRERFCVFFIGYGH